MNKLLKPAGVVIGILILIQLIPYGRDHQNPPVLLEPRWPNPQLRGLVKTACFDCHSNETTWPWYSNVAPISWLVQQDVEGGRAVMNFSEWGDIQKSARYQQQLDDSIQLTILSNEMPPFGYLLFHPDAVLPQRERDQILIGLKQIFERGIP